MLYILNSIYDTLILQEILIIIVEDVNDNKPIFDKAKYSFSVCENDPSGTIVGLVGATDADSGSNSELTYYVVDQELPFIFPENSTLLLKRPLDREEIAFYSFEVFFFMC